jgi:hypothetical protein
MDDHGAKLSVEHQGDRTQGKGTKVTRSILRRIVAVLAMIVAFGFATSAAASAAPASSHTAVSAGSFSASPMSAAADWWW